MRPPRQRQLQRQAQRRVRAVLGSLAGCLTALSRWTGCLKLPRAPWSPLLPHLGCQGLARPGPARPGPARLGSARLAAWHSRMTWDQWVQFARRAPRSRTDSGGRPLARPRRRGRHRETPRSTAARTAKHHGCGGRAPIASGVLEEGGPARREVRSAGSGPARGRHPLARGLRTSWRASRARSTRISKRRWSCRIML